MIHSEGIHFVRIYFYVRWGGKL